MLCGVVSYMLMNFSDDLGTAGHGTVRPAARIFNYGIELHVVACACQLFTGRLNRYTAAPAFWPTTTPCGT